MKKCIILLLLLCVSCNTLPNESTWDIIHGLITVVTILEQMEVDGLLEEGSIQDDFIECLREYVRGGGVINLDNLSDLYEQCQS